MRNLFLALAVGLIVGAAGALACTHFLGEGKELAETKSTLSVAKSETGKLAVDSQESQKKASQLATQVEQLTARNNDLKKQLESLKQGTAAPSEPVPPNPMMQMVKAHMGKQHEQRLQLLRVRLNLTPEQEAAVKAAMDEEAKMGEDAVTRMFKGGKIDPQAMADLQKQKTVDKTLEDVLSPEQKTAYTQMKSDEKTSQAETSATLEMNQMSPLLQLSETQKDQVYNALYQLRTNPGESAKPAPGNTSPTAYLDAQAQAKEAALAKVLTPEQLATYHEQAQSQLDLQKSMMQKFSPAPAAPGK